MGRTASRSSRPPPSLSVALTALRSCYSAPLQSTDARLSPPPVTDRPSPPPGIGQQSRPAFRRCPLTARCALPHLPLDQPGPAHEHRRAGLACPASAPSQAPPSPAPHVLRRARSRRLQHRPRRQDDILPPAVPREGTGRTIGGCDALCRQRATRRRCRRRRHASPSPPTPDRVDDRIVDGFHSTRRTCGLSTAWARLRPA